LPGGGVLLVEEVVALSDGEGVSALGGEDPGVGRAGVEERPDGVLATANLDFADVVGVLKVLKLHSCS